jgi:hypothetical protein
MKQTSRAFLGVLTVALALSAVVASAAQAAPEFWAEEFPASVFGKHIGNVAMTDEGSIVCEEGSYTGELKKEASSTLTLTPKYGKCKSQGWPVTFFWNGCDYLLHLKEKTKEENYSGNFDFACPAGKVIEAKAYSDAGHTTQICRMTISPQAGMLSVTYTNFLEAGQRKVEMTFKVGKFKYTQEGSFCVNGSFSNGELEGLVKLEAENEFEEGIDFEIIGM